MTSTARTALRLLAGVVLLLVAGCSVDAAESGDPRSGQANLTAAPVTDSVDLPDITLRDTHDQAYNVRNTPTTPWVLVAFGYSHCEPHCSDMVPQVAQALRASPSTVQDRVTALFITCDPARDTADRLSDYLRPLSDTYVGLTGDTDDIQLVADELGVAIGPPHADDNGGYHVGHGVHVVAFDPDRRARVMWPQGTSADEIAHDLKTLTGGR